ncbi:MAG: hypothetical protein A2Y22_07245 [Clostridiales bacterium GWD2_32_59]|nr:MAG: hypothetical protein A2Y22_07245 [Clostridiales bacterium GWD2_32_59]
MDVLLKNYFEKMNISKKKLKNLFLYFIQYIFAGVGILSWSYPFGFIFYVFGAEFLNKLFLKILIIASLVGKVSNYQILEYVVVLYLYDKIKDCTNSVPKKAAILSAINFILDLTMLYFDKSFFTYNIMLTVLESIAIFSLICISDKFFKITLGRQKRTNINNEEVVSLLFLITIMFAGFGNINFSGLSLLFIVGYIFVLLMGYSGGMLHGALAGCVVSAAIVISGNDYSEYHLLIPIVGMITGMFKTLGKTAMSLIFCVLSIFIYMLNSAFIIDVLDFTKNLLIAVLVFNILPVNISKGLEKIFRINGAAQIDKEMSKVKSEVAIKLENYAESFLQLASLYEQVLVDKKNINKNDAEKIFNMLIKKVCTNCECFNKCWQANFYTTSRNLYEIMNEMEKGSALKNILTTEGSESWCLNEKVLLENITELFEFYKSNIYLSNKIQKNKKLLSGQLYEIADMTQNICKEVQTGNETIYNIEENITSALEKLEIEVQEVLVIINDGKYKIEILLAESVNAVDFIVKELESILKKNLKVQYYNKEKDTTKIVLVQKEEYNVLFGAAQSSKGNSFVCGDSYKNIDLEDGNYVIVLSDGMGSGTSAERESKLTIELIEKFIKLGFSKNFIMHAINSLLIMNTKDELYATLDLLIIDRNTGKMEIIKVGSFPTFIKKQNEVEIITSESAPIGVLDDLNIEIIEKTVSTEDIIVTMTDGAISANRKAEEIKQYISEVLQNLYNNSPQEIAEYIMCMIKQKYKDDVDDDLTILVGKVVKN